MFIQKTKSLILIALVTFIPMFCFGQNSSDSNFATGLNLALNGELSKAKSFFTKSLTQDKHNYRAQNSLAIINELEKKSLNLKTTQIIFNTYKGDKSTKMQLDAAVISLSEAILRNPNNANLYKFRAIVLGNSKKFSQAIDDYDLVIKLIPNSSYAYENRGYLYQILDKNEYAISDFTKAIYHDSKNASAYNRRGLVYMHLGKYNYALADVNKTIELKPKSLIIIAVAHLNKGVIFLNQRHFEKAIIEFTRSIKLGAPMKHIYSYRGTAYQKTGNHDLAIQDYTKAISFFPNNPELYSDRALSFIDKKLHSKAIKDYSMAIKLNPTEPFYFYARSKLRLESNELKLALKDAKKCYVLAINKSLSLNPKSRNSKSANVYFQIRLACHKLISETSHLN